MSCLRTFASSRKSKLVPEVCLEATNTFISLLILITEVLWCFGIAKGSQEARGRSSGP